MTRRTAGIALLVAGLIINFTGEIPSIRETGVNAALTGASVIVWALGLFFLWKGRAPAGKTPR